MNRIRFMTVTCLGLLLAMAVTPSLQARKSFSWSAQIVVSGLDVPSMFTIRPDGRLLVAELKTGLLKVVDPVARTASVTGQVAGRLCTEATQGLSGVALSPAWPNEQDVWLYATRLVDDKCQNQLLRQHPDGTATVLYSEDYDGPHTGGRVAFGPDGFLYVSTGAGTENVPGVQNLASGKGKILRFTADGRPAGVVGGVESKVYAYGFRNVFGMDWDPRTGRLWATENGPECNDELNRIVAGGNYGWGERSTCSTATYAAPRNTNQDGPNPILPARYWNPSDGPTGLAFCDACSVPLDGNYVYGTYGPGHLHGQTGDLYAATLSSDRLRITNVTRLMVASPAAISIESVRGGPIYYSTMHGEIRRLIRTSR